MKIALLGNMNNNNFAIMRYFRDLGADAHLLLYENDGNASLSHFRPESDAWDIQRWASYIHQTPITNGEASVIGRREWAVTPFQPVAILKSLARTVLTLRKDPFAPPSGQSTRQVFRGYEKFIGSGIAPALFQKAGMELDIFYPYSTGIEFLGSPEFELKLRSRSRILSRASHAVRQLQADGIKSAKRIINAELSLTQRVFDELGVKALPLQIPMVYNREVMPEEIGDEAISAIAMCMKSSGMTLMSYSRLFWKRPAGYSDEHWAFENKNSDWILRALKQLHVARPGLNPLLLLAEYGPDVDATKKLADELGISDRIRWLPRMPRKKLMWLLARADVAVGEFYEVPDIIWGGTGWEALAVGKPLLQGFRFEGQTFERRYGYPPPPMLAVRGSEDVLTHLLDICDRPGSSQRIGHEAKAWFDQHNGIRLARQWLDVLEETTVAGRLH